MSTEIASPPSQNGVAQKPKNPVVELMQRDSVKDKFREILGNKSSAFISSVLAAVNTSDNLKKATPESVYTAAMMAAVLDLPVNPNLGFAYIIPYNNRTKDANGNDLWITVAQFQMGYKGFIQLAQRSGQYKTISTAPVYEGQIKSTDPLKGYVFDWNNKTSDKLIGYAAYIELINGFEKSLYMSVEELQKHGSKYSKTYSQNSSKWKTDFEAMAMKTVIKLLIAKYGPLSVDMLVQKSVAADQAVIKDAETLDVEYVDTTDQKSLNEGSEETTSENATTDPKRERIEKLIINAKTINDLAKHKISADEFELQQLYADKLAELTPKE